MFSAIGRFITGSLKAVVGLVLFVTALFLLYSLGFYVFLALGIIAVLWAIVKVAHGFVDVIISVFRAVSPF